MHLRQGGRVLAGGLRISRRGHFWDPGGKGQLEPGVDRTLWIQKWQPKAAFWGQFRILWSVQGELELGRLWFCEMCHGEEREGLRNKRGRKATHREAGGKGGPQPRDGPPWVPPSGGKQERLQIKDNLSPAGRRKAHGQLQRPDEHTLWMWYPPTQKSKGDQRKP